MREHHAHIAAYGQSLALPNLADCGSLEECLDCVRDAAAEVRAGGWVRMLGARIESWPERRWPTLLELDRAASHRSCVIMSFDHHAAAANTSAMRAGGVRAGQPVPPKGVVFDTLEDMRRHARQIALQPYERASRISGAVSDRTRACSTALGPPLRRAVRNAQEAMPSGDGSG